MEKCDINIPEKQCSSENTNSTDSACNSQDTKNTENTERTRQRKLRKTLLFLHFKGERFTFKF